MKDRNKYMRDWMRKHRKSDKCDENARWRAKTKLAEKYPKEFQKLLRAEKK